MKPTNMALLLKVFVEDPQKKWFGYDLLQHMKWGPGRLYPLLALMERDGWVSAGWETYDEQDESRRGAPLRRWYQITTAGVTAQLSMRY